MYLTMSNKKSWDTFRRWRFCSILFASSVNSLMPPPPNSMLCWRCGLCSQRNRKIDIVLGEGGKMWPRRWKSNFTTKWLNIFVAHCELSFLFIAFLTKYKILVGRRTFWLMFRDWDERWFSLTWMTPFLTERLPLVHEGFITLLC